MKILILGGSGMLGHQLFFDLQKKHEVRVSLREKPQRYAPYSLFNTNNSYFDIDLTKPALLQQIINDFQPKAIINAAGVIKQRQPFPAILDYLEMNALFPQRLAALCITNNIRLIHMSTDCVFAGMKGSYVEQDIVDAQDIYGKTKFLGEVQGENIISLRTSIIGLELTQKKSLIEWYLAQEGKIKGFTRAFFNGLTTREMSRIIHLLLTKHVSLSGLWNVSAKPISKYHLLLMLTKILQRKDITIEADNELFCDRTLDSSAFYQATNYVAPAWEKMLQELAVQIQHYPLHKRELCAH